MRSFVFISDIPDFLLQPIYKSEGKEGGGGGADGSTKQALTASKFDLRYERLRRLLVEYSTGVMLVMHLETKGYALALYASEGEALAACKADITPEQPGQRFRPLRLRILEREKPRPPEPVYNPYLNVEGTEVRKVDLADTRGLELVYRGRALAKWCPRTLAGEDCHFGIACLKLHKSAVQRTVRKRPRIDEEDAAAHLSAEQQQTVQRLLACVKDARAALAPVSLELKGCIYVPVTEAEMEAIFGSQTDSTTGNHSSSVHQETMYQTVLQRVEAAMASASSASSAGVSYFPRLSCPGGAPSDWAMESEEGRRALQRDCPLPANGAPTPLERDLYIQKLWYHMNQLHRCRTAPEVMRRLRGSRRVRDALRRRVSDKHAAASHFLPSHPHANAALASPSEAAAAPLYICLQPWLYLPTVGCEVSAFVERGGRRVRGVVQRYGQLRLMTSAALLATSTSSRTRTRGEEEKEGRKGAEAGRSPNAEPTSPQQREGRGDDADGDAADDSGDVDALLSRYAVLDSGNDSLAEASLAKELRAFQRCIAAAVNELRRHLQQHPSSTGGEGAAWCVHLAVLPLPPSTSMSSSSSLQSAPVTDPAGVAASSSPAAPSVVLLSCSAYQRALEECPMYSALAPSTSSSAAAEAADAPRPGQVEVTWNTQRHPYIPLFSREVLEKLRADATE
ncbi:hypothetical protein ABB37_05388 [Leptomonas pyrrhocoris]|uniref:Uncharacterized protein n=1 Tax=Leptomonas pyrrhocoris TaxID=157538 RepID=A0A0N0DV58_LEPPY|nr:hypothetical protein ABB37_05388 [Leptomonas pyrrhocoris]KPA79581.1 hypothetical protein ABB37_05388 [Leptomonas pyrrhocoris]|eukprot:XP_015658020.1 hypothetical protein ABB37_05388 [Leptomonas pyrrhocoris]